MLDTKSVHIDRIESITEGRVWTGGLYDCFGILGYFEGKEPLLSLGHHLADKPREILEKWQELKDVVEDCRYGKIVIVRVDEPYPEGFVEVNGKRLNYIERFREVVAGLRKQHPRAQIVEASYERGAGTAFSADTATLKWYLKKDRKPVEKYGFLRPMHQKQSARRVSRAR